MRIATFNLESLDAPPRAKLPLSERIQALRPQLQRLEADVLCLQEVNGQKPASHQPRDLSALEALLEDTPYAGFNRVETLRTEERGAFDVHNLVILSRFPVKSKQQLRHDLLPAAEVKLVTAEGASAQPIRFDRPLLAVELELPSGRSLHVINLHLRAPLSVAIEGGKSSATVWKSTEGWAEGYYLAEILRAGQALEARLLVDRFFDRDSDALIAVCGDINCEANETPLRIMQASEEDTGNARLAGRGLLLPERSLAADQRFSVLHHGRPQLLDHILLSRSLFGHFRRLEIHNEALEDELVAFARQERSAASYHAPVVASFADADEI